MLLGIITLTGAEVIYRNRIGNTREPDIAGGDAHEERCFVNTVDRETSMVRVLQENVTQEARRKGILVLSAQSRAILLSLFSISKLLCIFYSRGEASTMLARTRVTKERNETIVSGQLENECVSTGATIGGGEETWGDPSHVKGRVIWKFSPTSGSSNSRSVRLEKLVSRLPLEV